MTDHSPLNAVGDRIIVESGNYVIAYFDHRTK